MKNIKVKVSGLAMAMLLALPVVSMAQGMGQSQGMGQGQSGQMGTPPNQQKPPATDAKPAAPSAAPALNPEEEKAIKSLKGMTASDPKDIVQAGEGFMKKFPTSNYAETVYSILASAYMSAGDEQNTFKYGNLALAKNPDNIDALAVMTVATARRIDPAQARDVATKGKQVEEWGGKCITNLQNLVKPEGVSDADFARSRDGKMAMCYSGMGQAVYYQGKVADAAKDFAQATKLEGPQPDPVDLFLLGVALMDNKQYNEAVTAFQQCIKDTDQRMVPRCQDQLAAAKKEAAKAPKP